MSRGISAAEKYAEVGENRPRCDCHGELMSWSRELRNRNGGYWRCHVLIRRRRAEAIGRYPLVSAKDAGPAPFCECHNEPMQWSSRSTAKAGGVWTCAVAHRMQTASYKKTHYERLLIRGRERYQERVEENREYARQWRLDNLQKERLRGRKYQRKVGDFRDDLLIAQIETRLKELDGRS